MTWGDHFQHWSEARQARRNAEAQGHLQAARKRVAENTPEDWAWLELALADRERKWFVAFVFLRQPVPRRLLAAMMRAAVVDVDASTNRWFIRPCLESFGREAVESELSRLRDSGVASEERVSMANYWIRAASEFARGVRPARPDA